MSRILFHRHHRLFSFPSPSLFLEGSNETFLFKQPIQLIFYVARSTTISRKRTPAEKIAFADSFALLHSQGIERAVDVLSIHFLGNLIPRVTTARIFPPSYIVRWCICALLVCILLCNKAIEEEVENSDYIYC